MEEFIKLDKFGQLFIDKILFESYFPIVFTCLNEEKDVFIKDLYLCVARIMNTDVSGCLEKLTL